jgi:amino acid permease
MFLFFQFLVAAPPSLASLKSRNECVKAVVGSMAMLVVCYSTVAIFGYLTFGTKVDHDILVSSFVFGLLL